jgi:hypothetical protein
VSQSRIRVRRAIAILAAILLASVSLFDNAVKAFGLVGHELLVRVVCGVLAGVLLARFMRHLSPQNGDPEKDGRHFGSRLAFSQISDNAERVWRRYSPLQEGEEWSSAIQLFAYLLIDTAHIVRISEDVRVAGDILRNHVTMEISLDHLGKLPDNQKIVIPILSQKHRTFDRFEVRNRSDDKLARLPQDLIDGLLAWSIEGYFRLVYVGGSADRPEDLDEGQKRALFRLIALVCRPDIVDAETFGEEYAQATGGLKPRTGGDPELLRKICMYFAANTVTAVEAESNDGTSLIYVSYTDYLTNDRLSNTNDRIRTRFGIRPYRYRISIAPAYEATTYDLRVSGPDGHFVYRHYFMPSGSPSGELTPSGLVRHAKAGLQMMTNEGMPYTEVHTYGMTKAVPAEVECVVEFEEIPPGALRRTAAISAVCSLLLMAFAFGMPHTLDGNGGTDLAAFLLATPLFAATWVGPSSDRVQQSSLTTYAGLLVSAVLSLVASVLYVLQSLIWERGHIMRLSMFHYAQLPQADLVWLVLSAFSVTTTVYLAVQSFHRMSRYIRTLKRRSTGTPRPTRPIR